MAGAYGCPGCDGGPASSESVFFYKDRKGLPGKLIAECGAIKGQDNQGSFAIRLPKSCKVTLKGGKAYWVSVVATMSFNCCGEWNWETRNSQIENPAAWENPNRGDCRSWDVMTSCIGNYGEGPDFMFALKGADIVGED